jgi:site-specific recombinase XerD
MEFNTYLTQRTTTELVPATGIPSDQHPALVYLASLAAGSRRTMRQALDVMAGLLTGGRCDHDTLPWGALRFQHTQAVRSALMSHYSAATANKMLSALRQVLRTAWRLGYLSAEEYQRARDLKPVAGETPEAAAGRALSYGEWLALFAICAADRSPAGVRDAALIALLKVCGLRRAEVAALQVADYEHVTGKLWVRGKRNKVRVIPIEDTGAKDALADWLYLRGNAPGAIFTRILKGGTITQQGLTDQAIYYILQKRGDLATTAQFSPHDLRRTFAGDLLDAGADLSTVQKLMGHANANTTASYDRRGEQAKRSAVKKLHVPYQRRHIPPEESREVTSK